jgi:hypothetical protein
VCVHGGGADGNERLTAATAAVLIVLLAALGVTILSIGPLIWWHVLLGMLLIPPVLLKLGSTGWRFIRYYAGADGGFVVRLHKASFFVWVSVTGVHVLAHVRRLLLSAPVPGGRLRMLLLAGTIVAGAVLAIATVRYAQPWVHWFSANN